jgi:hypothetical protein
MKWGGKRRSGFGPQRHLPDLRISSPSGLVVVTAKQAPFQCHRQKLIPPA